MRDTFLDDVFKSEYELVKVLKNTDEKQICVYQHKTLKKRLVKRILTGDNEVYVLLKALSHDNISNIYDAYKTENSVVVLEEFIDGQTISEYLEDGLYTVSGVKKIVSKLCDALSFLHSHDIIHKDIKPENVMIDSSGHVKLIDFDAARIYKYQRSEDTRILGTTGYAAPEQYGLNQTDERTDIYALGVLMNVMLTGEPPERKLHNGRLRKVIVKCTQTIPNNRYQTAYELKRNL